MPRLWQIEERTCRCGIVGTVRLPRVGRVQQVNFTREREQSAPQRRGQASVANLVKPARRVDVGRALGVLAASVVALQIAQTILEEEVVRDTHISGPTRVRRFLSRFLVVLVVALAVEALITTFKASEDHALMHYASMLIGAVGLLLAGWGAFIRLNTSAEKLEPEAMEDAKKEDSKVQSEK